MVFHKVNGYWQGLWCWDENTDAFQLYCDRKYTCPRCGLGIFYKPGESARTRFSDVCAGTVLILKGEERV